VAGRPRRRLGQPAVDKTTAPAFSSDDTEIQAVGEAMAPTAAADPGPSAGEEALEPAIRLVYIRERRPAPELATAILALALALIAGLILGGSGVLIWDIQRHTNACQSVGPHMAWDQGLYHCVRVPVR